MNIIHDPAALYAARFEIRKCREAIKRLRQTDPTIRTLIDGLDEMAVDLTTELETIEPNLPLEIKHPVLARKVVPSVPGSVR